MISTKPKYLNVASSIYFIDNFINLDKSIFIKIAKFYPVIKFLLSKSQLEVVRQYRDALKKEILLEHDCKKKLKFQDNTIDHILCSHFLEHVYPDEAIQILLDFKRVLKPEGTLHLILPDLRYLVDNYIGTNNPEAADYFVRNTILTKDNRPSLKYRILEFIGSYGLQHYWMYDQNSMTLRLENCGFKIIDGSNVPSSDYRKNDLISFHLIAKK